MQRPLRCELTSITLTYKDKTMPEPVKFFLCFEPGYGWQCWPFSESFASVEDAIKRALDWIRGIPA